MKVLIVGGVAGGASAAARLRRLDENAEIIIFEKGEHISFANCGLPYYVGGTIEKRDSLLIQTPESMGKRFGLDIRVFSEVTHIDPNKKEVTVKEVLTGKTYTENYDKLILSPGAKPIRPNLPGINEKNIFTLRNIHDVDSIKSYIIEMKPKKAVVVGGGFIGIEMAENLVDLGIHVSLVELAPQVMAPLDPEMAAIIQERLTREGIDLYLNNGVTGFDHQSITTVNLDSEKSISTDIVILSIGVRPDVEFIKDTGILLGARGGILVNQTLQTSQPDIYAIGDAVEIKDFVNESQAIIPLAGPANKQGRIVADHIAGKNVKYKGTQGTSVVKIFDMTAASTGNNEKTLKRMDIEYKTVYIHPGSHAGYYPGAAPITLKLLFSPKDGKVLGAQAIGIDGVEKRIDVIATAIRAGMTVYDLEELELSYAPPYSSAKDPVNMAGYVAANLLEGLSDPAYLHELPCIDEDTLLLDVRTAFEYKQGHMEGAINIPIDELRNRLGEISKGQRIIVYCQVGIRGYLAERILKQHGFENVKNLIGGYRLYSMTQNPVEQIYIKDETNAAENPDLLVMKN